jgi:hypothetical protein
LTFLVVLWVIEGVTFGNVEILPSPLSGGFTRGPNEVGTIKRFSTFNAPPHYKKAPILKILIQVTDQQER